MFYNHTNNKIFDDFEHKYKDDIYALFPHISDIEIHFFNTEQYQQLEDVPGFDTLDYDAFAFSCNRINDIVIANVIFSPSICSALNFSFDELTAAIAHEIGHIIHYFNTALVDAPCIYTEMKADEVVAQLKLRKPLIKVLEKLIQSGKYSVSQCNDMTKRIMFLKM